MGRLDMAMDIDRLVEVEHPVEAPPQGVEDVMRILGAEAREDDAGPVGLAVAVGVLEVEELGAVGHIAPPSPGSMPVGISSPPAKTVV